MIRRTPRNQTTNSRNINSNNFYDATQQQKEDPESLAEFTVYSKTADWGGKTKISVYSDRIVINRISRGFQVIGPTRDSISFDEIESVTATAASHHIWGEYPGKFHVLCKKDTRYWEITKEVLNTEHRNYNRVLANEIIYDSEYNDIVEKNVLIISDAIRDYRNGRQKETEKQPSQSFHFENVNTTGGQVVFGVGDNNSISIDTLGTIQITTIAEQVQSEVKDSHDREEMLRILREIELALEDIKAGKPIGGNKGLKDSFENYLQKYSWFFAEIVGLVGNVVLKKIGWL